MTLDWTERPDSPRSWLVAILGTVAMVFTFGTPLSYGIFREPFSEAFAVSPIALSAVFSVMLFTFFIGSGAVGVFGTRYPARGLLLMCAATTALLAPSLYLADSLLWLSVVFALFGLVHGTVYVLIASIVPRWFDRRRGVATGLVFVGIGFGLFALPPVWQLAIAEFGVRLGFALVTGVTAIAFVLAAVSCRRPTWTEQSTASARDALEWLSRLGGTRTFQLLFVGIGFAFAWYQLLAAYAVDLFAARGFSEPAAATAFGAIGGVSIVSRLGSGYVADLVGSRRAFLASLLCTTAGIALLFAAHPAVLGVGIVLIGLGLGGSATLYIPLLMGIYDPGRDTAIVGVFNVAIGIWALAMPPVGAASITYTGEYTVALTLTLLLSAVSVLTVRTATR